MSYYIETARPAMMAAAEDLGGMAERYTTEVAGSCGAMGAFSWPFLLAFCQSRYNESLGIVRDASTDTGQAVSAVARELKQIVSVYERLEQNNEVK